jgi:threonine aldolase
MRQVGILAAAGRYAIEHNLARLADDHARAQRLTAELGGDVADCPTNIALISVADAAASAAAARERDVLFNVVGPKLIRLVTHLDIDDDAIDQAIKVLRPLVV